MAGKLRRSATRARKRKNDVQSTCNRKNVTNLIVVCNNRRFIVLEYNNAGEDSNSLSPFRPFGERRRAEGETRGAEVE